MKLFLFFMLLSIMAISQQRFGYTKEEIMAYYENNEFMVDTTDKGTVFIATHFDIVGSNYIYYFDDDGYCIKCLMIPDNVEVVNMAIEYYNNNYHKVDATNWDTVIEGGAIMYVRLSYSPDGLYVFEFMYENIE